MGRKSTRLKIVFFGLLLVGFIGIQYSWVRSIEKNKLQQFRSRMIMGLEGVARDQPFASTVRGLADTAISSLLRRSFLSKGLGNVRFEYAIALGDKQLTSPGFHTKQTDTANNLVLHYVLQRTGQRQAPDELMTVVVPLWKKFALRKMGWTILASVLLTIMISAVFCSASFFAWRKQQTLYDSRSKLIQNMMQQLEAPLSTVSLAADALRNTKVMHDPGKVDYYQQILTQESQRMNEQVERFLNEIRK